MLRNYLTVAWRNLQRHGLHALINVTGLAIGMTCCMLILQYVRHELSFDRFHSQADRIYRVLQWTNAKTPFPLADIVVEEVPEALARVRISNTWDRQVEYGGTRAMEDGYRFADAELFSVFSFPFVCGDPQNALHQPDAIVLSQQTAERYFGEGDPLGKRLLVDNRYERIVTGVVDVPENSHVHFDLIASMASARQELWDNWFEHWGMYDLATYLLLQEGSDPGLVAPKLTRAVSGPRTERNPELGPISLRLQPLTDIHLRSASIQHELEPQGHIADVYAFAGIAVLVLAIACLNFTNLATARSVERAREVGMRKVVGAERPQLVGQFLAESLLLAGFSLLLAVALAELCLPAFNVATDKHLTLMAGGNWQALPPFVALAVVTGIAAGVYPALFLSAFRPVEVWRGRVGGGRRAVSLRRWLVVLQFAITTALLVGAGAIYGQMRYLKTKRLGFAEEQLVTFDLPDRSRREQLMSALGELTQVVGASAANHFPPHRLGHSTLYRPEGASEETWCKTVMVDDAYFGVLQVPFAAGRPFSREVAGDVSDAMILNQAAVAYFDLEEPLGAYFPEVGWNHQDAYVIGIVEDFHFEALHDPIRPIVFLVDPQDLWRLVVRLRADDVAGAMAAVRTAWEEVFPEWVFEYRFVDESFDAAYRAEERTARLIGYASALAVLVACLGLAGLASFTAEQRTKEIGIRKSLGASTRSVVVLLTREFTILVAVANLIGWPAAYLAVQQWLEQFAYRIELGPSLFAAGAVGALLIAWLTVGWQTARAATANPVDALRYE